MCLKMSIPLTLDLSTCVTHNTLSMWVYSFSLLSFQRGINWEKLSIMFAQYLKQASILWLISGYQFNFCSTIQNIYSCSPCFINKYTKILQTANMMFLSMEKISNVWALFTGLCGYSFFLRSSESVGSSSEPQMNNSSI